MKISSKYLCFLALVSFTSLTSCTGFKQAPEVGVSMKLALARKEQLSDISYTLHFDIPDSSTVPVYAHLTLSFTLMKKEKVTLDFKADDAQIKSLYVNGIQAHITHINEHIVIEDKYLEIGTNQIRIDFITGDMSLNRNDDYLYTLLVPDRARTLFPCFDQPDLKAIYHLSLTLPQGWKGVANGKIATITHNKDDTSKLLVNFEPTEPLSTYLFSFVAGDFQQSCFMQDGRPISIYHRETDREKLSQIDLIAAQIYFCLHWMEQYTGIPYPFAKYDAIILPGFQYGGMEHTGATLYNDKRILLGSHPTTDEQLSRAELIAHETAHLWFGDYVTMKWFDDVWTKEVFAGYFASEMVEPLFPQLNHKLNALKQFTPPAYSEDRTMGAVPIKQHLDNLQDAGLIYTKTIYNKAPLVMRMLANKLGADSLRSGLQIYVQKYGYGNASWEDLITILDGYTSEDLKAWSHVWVSEKGMPEILLSAENDTIKERHVDAWNLERIWPQPLRHELIPGGYVVPNTDGQGYGFFRLDAKSLPWNLAHWGEHPDPLSRLSILINLHEYFARNILEPETFAHSLFNYMPDEENVQVFSYMITCMQAAMRAKPDLASMYEEKMWNLFQTHNKQEYRQLLFNYFLENSITHSLIDILYQIWENQQPPNGIYISENQYITLAYELAIRLPQKADSILSHQRLRLTHIDRIREFDFIAPALSPQKVVRDSLFRALLKAENRKVEPWTVKALRYLNHPLRQEDALDYIEPALWILPEIQNTGDIFLPSNWCAALLDGHNSLEAAVRVQAYLSAHETLPPLLKSKVLQGGDRLLRK